MFKTKKYMFLIVASFILAAISIYYPGEKSRKDLSLQEITPFLKQIKKIKNESKRDPAADGGVTVRFSDQSKIRLEPLDYQFSSESKMNETAVSTLRDFINSELTEEGYKDGETSLKLINQYKVRERTYIKFQQITNFNLQGQEYEIPVQGGQALAVVENGKLMSIQSSLMKVSYSGSVYSKTGMEFEFSDREFSKFVNLIKIHKLSKRLMKTYMAKLIKDNGVSLSFEDILNRRVSEQRVILNTLFKNIGADKLQKILKDLALANRLFLVRHGTSWGFQVSNFFELPVRFQIGVGGASEESLKVKHLMQTYHRLAAVRSFESPLFPAGKKETDTNLALEAKDQLEKILAYTNTTFGWGSYMGEGSDDPVNIHTGLLSVDFIENAAWVGSVRKILVGGDGANLQSIHKSLSILGHEYAHAIIQFSSGLLYQGQSGAINEHFADMLGAAVEASKKNGEYQYTIGEDVLRPETRSQKEDLRGLLFKSLNYSEEQKKVFRLGEVGMRHLYAPELSYTTQYQSMTEVREYYPEDCEPSYDNDNCGVHTASGVLNKALSLTIGVEGIDKILPIIFNTAVFRLNESASFVDYVVELNHECRDVFSKVDDPCDVLLASFASVGVAHPDYPIDLMAVRSKSGEESSVTTESAVISMKPKVAEKIPVQNHALSPTLNLCGWVEQIDPQNYRIFDGKFNALLLNRNFTVKTEGDYSLLSDMGCACVEGRITQQRDLNFVSRNIFSNVDSIVNRGNKCSEDGEIKNIKPDRKLRFQDVLGDTQYRSRGYCGWVSVNSKSRNVTIIDNRFDAVILVNDDPQKGKDYRGSLTGGVFPEIYDYECACVRSELRETLNSKGNVFNSFLLVEGIEKKPYEACIGFEWK